MVKQRTWLQVLPSWNQFASDLQNWKVYLLLIIKLQIKPKTQSKGEAAGYWYFLRLLGAVCVFRCNAIILLPSGYVVF